MKIKFYLDRNDNINPIQPGDISVGAGKVHLCLRTKSERVAVYDAQGEPSESLDGYTVWVKTKNYDTRYDDFRYFSTIKGWKTRIPHDIVEIELISPQGDKVQLEMIKGEGKEELAPGTFHLHA